MKLASVQAIAGALNEARVPFIVAGGLAVNAHGFGRLTWDVDLVIRLDPDAIRRAFAALGSLGYAPLVPITADGFADPARRERWIREKGMVVLSFHSEAHRETPVDVFATEPFDFVAEYERSLVQEVAPGVPVRILALDTLVRLKRAAGRPRDNADLAELRLLHGDLGDG
jgi:hypothetical protein